MTEKPDGNCEATFESSLDLGLDMSQLNEKQDVKSEKNVGLFPGHPGQISSARYCESGGNYTRSTIPTSGLALLSAAAADSSFDSRTNNRNPNNLQTNERKRDITQPFFGRFQASNPALSPSLNTATSPSNNYTINVPKYPQPKTSLTKVFDQNSVPMTQVPTTSGETFSECTNQMPYVSSQQFQFRSEMASENLPGGTDFSKDGYDYMSNHYRSHQNMPSSFLSSSYQNLPQSDHQFHMKGGMPLCQMSHTSRKINLASVGPESQQSSCDSFESPNKDRPELADSRLTLDIEVVDLQHMNDKDLNKVVSSLGYPDDQTIGSCGTSPASTSSTPSPSSHAAGETETDSRNFEGERLQKISKSSGVFRTKYFPDGTNLKLAEQSLKRVLPYLKHKSASATVSSAAMEVNNDAGVSSDVKVDDVTGKQVADSSTGSSEQSDLVMKKEVFCQVCGDIAAGFYCGAYICEACKKFFVRASRQEKIKYVCHKSENCVITKETRVRCQYCRYQKCLTLNMYSPGDSQGKEAAGSISNIPCRVCGGASSGFHFGALTCEGCKGFFRRMAKEREWHSYKCSKENTCEISMSTRNVCKACRYRKCLEAGMSVEASRIGRQPNAIKHAISVEARKQGTKTGDGKSLPNQFSVDFAAFSRAHAKTPVVKVKQELDMEVVDETIRMVKEAWKELSTLYTQDKVCFQNYNLKCDDVQNTWKTVMTHFEFNAKSIIKFSKKLPKFQSLCIEDQVSLIQMSTYSLCILNHCQYYNVETGVYRFFDFTKEEEEAILKFFPQFSLITNHFHHFGLLLKTPNFDETELAFLSSLVLLNSENLSLKNKDAADKLHGELMESLQMYIQRNHTDYETRMGYLLLRISELALASLQHNQCVGAVAKANPELENQLWEEMYLK